MKLNIQTIIHTEEHKKQTRWNVLPGWTIAEALTISALLQNFRTVALLSSDLHPPQCWSDTDKHKTTTITPHFYIMMEIIPRDSWLSRYSLSSWVQIYHWFIHMCGLPGFPTPLVRETVFRSRLRQQWAEQVNILILTFCIVLFFTVPRILPALTQSGPQAWLKSQ